MTVKNIQDHWQSCPLDRVHTTSYSTLLETMHLSCTIFKLRWVICWKCCQF